MNTIKLSEVIKRQPIINIGTIGHVSHGKSTVVFALTGKKTQEHSAEQVRNITINLGYANTKIWYNKDSDEFKTTNSDIELDDSWQLLQHFSFVDCPGHNAYLSTMISGAGAMNGVDVHRPDRSRRERSCAARGCGRRRVVQRRNGGWRSPTVVVLRRVRRRNAALSARDR